MTALRGLLLKELFHVLRDDESGARRRLWALRDTPEYERAYGDPEPSAW